MQKYCTPEGRVDPSRVLDASGRLDAAFAAHRVFQYQLTVQHTDLVPVRWRWLSIGDEEQRDLREVTLLAAGRIVGTVVDPTGAPLDVRTWSVYATEAGCDPLTTKALPTRPLDTCTTR